MPLLLAGTPIGNLKDATDSLREALAAADVIAAEDTRRTRNLITALGIDAHGKMVSFFDGNEAERVPELLAELQEGKLVVVVSDAGMPTVSDPGYRLIHAAAEAGIEAHVAPGPSAVLTALALSGLPTDRFAFEGFLPSKPQARRQRLDTLAGEQRTLVFFESPHRVAETLAAMRDSFGALRPASVSRELTKLHEETKRGTLEEVAAWAAEGARGEYTIVVGGARATEADPAAAVAEVRELVTQGVPHSQAAAQVAQATGLSRKKLYNATL
ncbi:MAG: 16S rRNA (cytidine(1402)-2'-O)-methyltransferase [Propionibacteriaceae bacterium]|jgi:16S rRNA (cytidine1402-2'-O)-methyltransferase|nr:16S rRNA (cytidine(1402)-2'-O)-methyltransferase [Propionibacteriaceae bacterium]